MIENVTFYSIFVRALPEIMIIQETKPTAQGYISMTLMTNGL